MSFISAFDGLIWLTLALTVFVFLQRFLHREIQAVLFISTRNQGITQILFALIFFPGVLLHELSHYISAILLGVKTGRFSLIPNVQPDGKLRLGYVETASGGFVRDSLIGAAPLITGSLFVAYTAIYQIHLLPLGELIHNADWKTVWVTLAAVPKVPDFWLWFYLAFTISSTMLPSQSDRHAWLPFGMIIVGVVCVAVIAGMGTWFLSNLAPSLNQFFRAMAMIFGLSGVLHLLLILPFSSLHLILTKITGIDID